MFKRKRNYFLIGALILAGVGVYFEPTYHVRGWLHREAFFEDRPTSYWREVLVHDLEHLNFFLSPQYEPPTFWQRCKTWIGYRPRVDSSEQLLREGAEPILSALAADTLPQVAGFSRDALEFHATAPGDPSGVLADRFWMKSIIKHHLKNPQQL